MRRVALFDYGKLELQTDCAGIGSLRSGMVKVDVHACAICGSDIALYRGQRSLADERYFGHEFSGVVVDAGNGANGIRNGMRVASELNRTCGQCWNCLNGLANYCKSMNEALLPGGFSEETFVLNTPEYSFISPITDTIDFETASMLEPTNCAYRIARQANITPGSNILIFGLGTMGLITAMILKTMGASRIIGIERSQPRLKKVRSLDLIETIDRNDSDWLEQVREMSSKQGVDVVIEATGAVPVLKDAFDAVRPGGKVVIASVYHDAAGDLTLLPIMRKELTLIGAKGPYPHRKSDGTSAPAEILVRLQKELKKLITVYEFKDALQAFDDMMSGSAIKAVVRFK